MARKKLPLFNVAIAVIAAAAVGGGWFVWDRARAATAAERELVRLRAELQAVADAVPAPSRETAAEIEADLARARRALATMQAELRGRGPTADRLAALKPPGARTDAFFDLATFVERSRVTAQKQGIAIGPDATHFGFSLYANEGPEAALIEPVFRQRLAADYLVGALFSARPRAVLAVQRERPLTAAERKTRADDLAAAIALAASDPASVIPPPVPEGSASISPDYFDLDPRLTVPDPELVEVSAFRLIFTGPTAVLRALLNQLATFELPVIVRTVEVEPATGDDLLSAGEEAAAPPAAAPASTVLIASVPRPTSANRGGTLAPLVPKSVSKFTVTVEFVELVPPAAVASDTP